MPSSIWNCECLRQSLVARDVRCARKEFFNPILKPAYEHVLAKHVGCEMVSTLDNLCQRVDDAGLAELMARAWKPPGLGFTKDNFLAWSIDQFAKHFAVVRLRRPIQWCLPPRFVRVAAWYDGWFQSMLRSGLISGFEDASFYVRAIIAWHTIDRKLDSYMLPTLVHETCFHCTREEVAAHACQVLPDHVFDPHAFARHVVASPCGQNNRTTLKPSEHLALAVIPIANFGRRGCRLRLTTSPRREDVLARACGFRR